MSELDWKYIVWVGGVDDYYTSYEKAKKHYNEWIKKGYDDVTLETVSEKIGIKTDTTIST